MADLVEILAQGPWKIDQLSLSFTKTPPELNPTVASAAYIEDCWQEYVHAAQTQGRTLFDSPVCRFLGWQVTQNRLFLTLALTSYKHFIVTTLRNRDWFMQHDPNAISPVLGNSILLTYRGRGVLGIRSRQVSAYPEYAHVIGGVFDVPPGINWDLGTQTQATPILEHLIRETREELGISADDLATPPRLLGLFRDRFLAQPELLWQAELKDDPHTWMNRPADGEHKRLVLLAPGTKPDCPLTPLAGLGLSLVFPC